MPRKELPVIIETVFKLHLNLLVLSLVYRVINSVSLVGLVPCPDNGLVNVECQSNGNCKWWITNQLYWSLCGLVAHTPWMAMATNRFLWMRVLLFFKLLWDTISLGLVWRTFGCVLWLTGNGWRLLKRWAGSTGICLGRLFPRHESSPQSLFSSKEEKEG